MARAVPQAPSPRTANVVVMLIGSRIDGVGEMFRIGQRCGGSQRRIARASRITVERRPSWPIEDMGEFRLRKPTWPGGSAMAAFLRVYPPSQREQASEETPRAEVKVSLGDL